MVVDVRLSADVVTEFQEHLAAGGDSLPISFSTMVLQSATWPLHPSASSVFIPPLLQSAISKVGIYQLVSNKWLFPGNQALSL